MKRNCSPPKSPEVPKRRGFGLKNYEELIPPEEELAAQLQKLPKFSPRATDELLAAARARANAQSVSLDAAIGLERAERTTSQLKALLKALGLNPAAPNVWRDGFIKLAKLHHNASRLVHSWSKQSNPARWSFKDESWLLAEVYEWKQLGYRERPAVELIASGKTRSELPQPAKVGKAGFDALWRKYMRLKKERTSDSGATRWQWMLGSGCDSSFERNLFLVENPELRSFLVGDNQSPKKLR
jgi:hypothetical protein